MFNSDKPAHYPFLFQATLCWYDEDIQSNKYYRIAGLGFCTGFADAVSQIEKREGNDLESIEHIELIGERDESIIEIHPDWVYSFLHTDPCNMPQEIDGKGRPLPPRITPSPYPLASSASTPTPPSAEEEGKFDF